MRVAVTTTDGKYVNTHFGKAETIYIFDIEKDGIKYLEKRKTNKYCSDNPKHAFRQDAFDNVYQIIKDCDVLYTQQIGAIPAEKCRSLGIQVKQAEGKIEEVIGI